MVGLCAVVFTVVCMCVFAHGVHAASPSAAQVKNLVAKTVKKQTKKMPKKDKTAKVEKIFRYADNRFVYKPLTDKAFIQASLYKQLNGKNIRLAAYTMLKNRKGTCFHEAAALAYLIKYAAGCPAQIVIGQTDAFNGEKQLHAWVEAQIDGVWLAFDSNLDRAKGKNLAWYRILTDGSDERYSHYAVIWRKAI